MSVAVQERFVDMDLQRWNATGTELRSNNVHARAHSGRLTGIKVARTEMCGRDASQGNGTMACCAAKAVSTIRAVDADPEILLSVIRGCD